MSVKVQAFCDFHGCGKEFDPAEGGEIIIHKGLSKPRSFNFCPEHFDFIGKLFYQILTGKEYNESDKTKDTLGTGSDLGDTDGPAPIDTEESNTESEHRRAERPRTKNNIVNFTPSTREEAPDESGAS